MKNIRILLLAVVIMSAALPQVTYAQAIDDERMKRDIEVAENVLATLIKQELEQQHRFIGLDIKGSYQPGYGVTFRVPSENGLPFVVTFTPNREVSGASATTIISSDGNTYEYSYQTPGAPEPPSPDENAVSLGQRARQKAELRGDSVRQHYNDRIISAAQSFILDYGDFISQLKPDERIVVTNQSDRAHYYFNQGKRSRITVEGTRGDVTSFRQGKLTRDQALKKLNVINTETLDKKEPDLEMMSSIFSRLYRPDLSKTYFAEGNVYYERLRDFGAVFYMRVVSTNEIAPGRYSLPTANLHNIDKATRDQKVTELYPAFETEMKQNIVDYGRTVKSLGDNESLVFNIILTSCKGCKIPGTLELSVKASVLRDFAAGKLDQKSAISKISVKKGQSQ